MGTAKGDGYTITPRDLELVVNAINCTRLPFEIEYEKLSKRLGYKNAQSAKAAWNALKRKLDKVAEGAEVVPSLTIEPEPLRRGAEAGGKDEANSSKKKGKRPVVQSEDGSSEDESESEEGPVPASRVKKTVVVRSEPEDDGQPVQKAKKSSGRSKRPRAVDVDGDVSMAESSRLSKPAALQSKCKPDGHVEGKKRRRVVSSSSSSSSSTSDSESDTPPPKQPKAVAKRTKLQSRLKDLSVGGNGEGGTRTARKTAKADRRGKGKTAAELETEAFLTREKAFEALGMPGALGGGDEDDEEIEPPPAYVKKED